MPRPNTYTFYIIEEEQIGTLREAINMLEDCNLDTEGQQAVLIKLNAIMDAAHELERESR